MSAWGLVSRVTPVHAAKRNCARDGGGPSGIGNQVLISSHRKLLRSKAVVVSVAEKPGRDFTDRREGPGITGILSRTARVTTVATAARPTARIPSLACHTAVMRVRQTVSRFLDITIIQFSAAVIRGVAGRNFMGDQIA